MPPRRKQKPLEKLHTAGILAALTTLVGVLSLPEVLGLLPPRWAMAVTILGVVLQAVTKGVAHGNTELIPREKPFSEK